MCVPMRTRTSVNILPCGMSYVLPCYREPFITLNSADMDTTISSTSLPDDVRDVFERDQRTVRTLSISTSHCRTTSPLSTFWCDLSSSSYRTGGNRLHRLREVFALCACLLAVLRFPTTSSAPAAMSNPINFDKPPLWKNPCHVNQVPSDFTDYISENDVSVKEILSKVIVLTSNAIEELSWKNAWVEHAFQKDFQTYYDEMKATMNPPDYLPSFAEVKKELGEPISEEELKTLDKAETLQKTYEWLQRVAVGMEQLVYDQFTENEEFKKEFKEAYFALRSVLCEISEAMNNLKVSQLRDVDRTDMPVTERKATNETDRKMRDWTIFVIYINLLEYTKQAFEHLAVHES